MSTVKFTLSTQEIDFAPVFQGYVNVIYNDGNQDFDLQLDLANLSVAGKFLEVPWLGGALEEPQNIQQAQNYVYAFNRDYKSIGGTNNLTATKQGNEVTITAINGTFTIAVYIGNVLIMGTPVIDNSPQISPPEVSASLTGNGSCTTVEYSVSASGGTAPYTLKNGSTTIQSGWNGSADTVNINRESGSVNFNIVDDNGQVDSLVLIVPRKLKSGEFKINATQYVGYSDVLIESLNPVANTTPLQYSIDIQGTLTGGNYQSSNTFPGLLPGIYELFVKDKYGCEITKTIQIYDLQDATEEQNPRYFDIPKGNSIIMSECVTFDKDIKPNYNNTLSFNELSSINYKVVQYYDPSDYEPVHFKSSYPYHVITLHKCDGSKQDLPPILIQENLGSKEKVDCELFPLNGQTAVYFDGGNQYEPGTNTIIGASEYTQFLPDWGIEGQIVSIDGMGAYEIVEVGYDSDLQKAYFVVDTIIGSPTSGKVQVTWNIQPYNVYECYVPFSSLKKGRLVIEKGFSFDEIDGKPWISELLASKENENDDLLIEWSSSKNQSDIVFFSGVTFTKRMKGKLRPIFPNTSEIAEGDSRAYSISQEFYQHYSLELEPLSAREVNQLLVASKTDGFKVNGENLVMKQEAEIEPLGESNYFSFKCDYAYGGNLSAIQPDSLALNSSTGVVGGGGTGKPSAVPNYDGKSRISVDGGFMTVGGEFISIDS